MSSFFQSAPDGWKRVPLKFLVDGPQNGSWGSEEGEDDIDTLCIRVADFDWPHLRLDMKNPTMRSFKETQAENLALKNGDIILEKSGGGEKTPVGRVVKFTLSDAAVTSNFVARVRPLRGAHPDFMLYLLAAQYMSNFTIQFVKQNTGIQNLDDAALFRSDVWLPDLPTQKRIAAFLDRETARIDALIAKKGAFLEKANEHWKATLNHQIFPGSPDWSKLPDGWRKVQLKHLTDQSRPIMYGIVLPGPSMEEGPMIVKGGDVKPGRLNPDRLCRTTTEIEASYKRSRLKEGDLVISIRGGIGDIESVPAEIEGANLTQDAARIATARAVDAVWLRYALLSPAVFHPLEAKSMGAAVRGINIFDLKRVYVPTPPPEQQYQIAHGLSEQEERLGTLRTAVLNHTDRLREYRAALITVAVTGQIDVDTYARSGTSSATLDRIEEEMQG